MRIKVIKTPDGQAPGDIREDWVGLILPAIIRDRITIAGVLTPDIPLGKRDVFVVLVSDAISALTAAGKTRSAQWWADLQLTNNIWSLAFMATDVELLEDAAEAAGAEPETELDNKATAS
jgi:hypothetical protein